MLISLLLLEHPRAPTPSRASSEPLCSHPASTPPLPALLPKPLLALVPLPTPTSPPIQQQLNPSPSTEGEQVFWPFRGEAALFPGEKPSASLGWLDGPRAIKEPGPAMKRSQLRSIQHPPGKVQVPPARVKRSSWTFQAWVRVLAGAVQGSLMLISALRAATYSRSGVRKIIWTICRRLHVLEMGKKTSVGRSGFPHCLSLPLQRWV